MRFQLWLVDLAWHKKAMFSPLKLELRSSTNTIWKRGLRPMYSWATSTQSNYYMTQATDVIIIWYKQLMNAYFCSPYSWWQVALQIWWQASTTSTFTESNSVPNYLKIFNYLFALTHFINKIIHAHNDKGTLSYWLYYKKASRKFQSHFQLI